MPTVTDWIQAGASVVNLVAIVVLVLVTWRYVSETARLARATEKQAEATVEQAEASNKTLVQTLRSSCPVLLFDEAPKGQGVSSSPSSFVVRIVNHGPGVALGLKVGVEDPIHSFDDRTFETTPAFSVVAPGEHREPHFRASDVDTEQGYAAHTQTIWMNYSSVFGVEVDVRHDLSWSRDAHGRFDVARGKTMVKFNP